MDETSSVQNGRRHSRLAVATPLTELVGRAASVLKRNKKLGIQRRRSGRRWRWGEAAQVMVQEKCQWGLALDNAREKKNRRKESKEIQKQYGKLEIYKNHNQWTFQTTDAISVDFCDFRNKKWWFSNLRAELWCFFVNFRTSK
jgi:hypothetical protein